jgi:hypothetical protein
MSQTAPGESTVPASRMHPISPLLPSFISAGAIGTPPKSDAPVTGVASLRWLSGRDGVPSFP